MTTLQKFQAHLVPFFTLSYPTSTPPTVDSFPNSSYYGIGLQDIYLIITCIAVMAILRDAFRLCILEPFARWKLMRDLNLRKQRGAQGTSVSNGKANGVANGYGNGHTLQVNGYASRQSRKELRHVHRSVLRFAEQGWCFSYYTFQWSYGLYVHRSLPTRVLDPIDLWLDYPHTPLAGPLKFYYLMQTAFYLHAILVLNAEARRKDHIQMMTHHIITIALLGASYCYNFTRVGCVILVLMDWCDIFLPLAKMIRYLQISQTLTDTVFGWFLASWLVTRHILFLFVMVSAYFDAPRLIPFEWAPAEGRYLTKNAYITFNALLLALQTLQIIWFGMICRVAWRVVSGQGATDERSDEEYDDDTRKDQ